MDRRAWLTGAAAFGATTVALTAPQRVAADDLDNGRFRGDVMALLARERPQWKVAALPADPFGVSVDTGQIYLGNLWRTVSSLTGKERDTAILTFFDTTRSLIGKGNNESFATVSPALRARIVHADFGNPVLTAKDALVLRPLSKNARIAYVIDSEQAVRYVTASYLKDWATDVDTIHALAIANLDAAVRDTVFEVRQAEDEARRFTALALNDSYAAARLLSPGFMARVREQLGPKVFVGVPNRDFWVAWGPAFARRSNFAAKVAEDAGRQAYALTGELFVSTAAGVRPATGAELADHGR
jgi:Protein of unknown function (DUF1444)